LSISIGRFEHKILVLTLNTRLLFLYVVDRLLSDTTTKTTTSL